MGYVQIFINHDGIDRTTILSRTNEEEAALMRLYSVISEDLRSIHDKIINHGRAKIADGEIVS